MNTTPCPDCHGTGWKYYTKKDREYVSLCPCKSNDILISKGAKFNIPGRFLGAELKGFDNHRSQSLEKAIKEAKKFITEYPAFDTGILFQGPVGVGKTRLLCSIASELIKKFNNIELYYIDWNDLVRKLGSGEDHISRDFGDIHRLIQKLVSTDLLLFDEIGASKTSPYVSDNIYYLFNKRYNNKKITICATNFSDSPAEGRESLSQRIGTRIRSRLYEMTVVKEIQGIDYRQKAHTRR